MSAGISSQSVIAVIVVSHDRHMIELTTDRLVLVENGGATEYGGSVDDYIDLVLGGSQPQVAAKAKQPKLWPQGGSKGARRSAGTAENGGGSGGGERATDGAALGNRSRHVRSCKRAA